MWLTSREPDHRVFYHTNPVAWPGGDLVSGERGEGGEGGGVTEAKQGR